MDRTKRFVLRVPDSGRTISDAEWETIDLAHAELWKSASRLLRTHTAEIKGHKYNISMDLTPIARRHRKSFKVMTALYAEIKKGSQDPFSGLRFPSRPSNVGIEVTFPELERDHATSAIECAIYDIFLIMNLAAPGCCHFYRSSLFCLEKADKQTELPISLNNTCFETALLHYIDFGWPAISILPLDRVTKWYNSVRSGASQVPNNATERALFALFHIANSDLSPTTVIWLFYALESLLQTRPGENLNSITNRLFMLLEVDDSGKSKIKKKLRSLYDLRSSIIHGGLEVIHPIHAETIDERVDGAYSRLMDVTDFAHAALIAALQKMIINGWNILSFEETVSGSDS